MNDSSLNSSIQPIYHFEDKVVLEKFCWQLDTDSEDEISLTKSEKSWEPGKSEIDEPHKQKKGDSDGTLISNVNYMPKHKQYV